MLPLETDCKANVWLNNKNCCFFIWNQMWSTYTMSLIQELLWWARFTFHQYLHHIRLCPTMKDLDEDQSYYKLDRDIPNIHQRRRESQTAGSDDSEGWTPELFLHVPHAGAWRRTSAVWLRRLMEETQIQEKESLWQQQQDKRKPLRTRARGRRTTGQNEGALGLN